MSEKHLSTGSTCPPLAPGTLRIYSMKYCPYAQRARLVLAHKNIPHETVNVNLKAKPEWYFSKNPAGLVPTLEQDDKLVQESGICMDYLDDITPGDSLYPKDAYLKARMRLDMDKAAKYIPSFYKLARCKIEEREQNAKDLLEKLAVIETMVKGKFVEGDTPMMIDYFIYPWIERFGIIKAMAGIDLISPDRFPKLAAWFSHMVALPAVRATFTSTEDHVTYGKMYAANQIDYDFALKKIII